MIRTIVQVTTSSPYRRTADFRVSTTDRELVGVEGEREVTGVRRW